ncbi:MAG: alpha/beta hydrolase [Actinobacteria bacterium]|nr:alpha/beta hydrolase [Actinomycetota bacterium]
MPLHPQSEELVERAAALGVSDVVGLAWEEIRVLELRELELKGEAPAVASEDLVVPAAHGGVPVRVYRPGGRATALVVYFHGGGWCAGSVALSDPDCRVLATRAEAVVVSVDYRLAPEHPFPAGLDDCWEVVDWAARNREEIAPGAARLVTAGSSAGGNLAAVVALRARAAGGPEIDLQVLLCPALDLSFDYPSCVEDLGGFWLGCGDMRALAAAYVGDRDPGVWGAPAREPDLCGLPATLIVTAEYDVLRDEAEQFGERLAAADVPVRTVRFPGMLHGFYEYRAVVDAADEVWDLAGGAIRDPYSIDPG